MALPIYLILRSGHRPRLEGRTMSIRGPLLLVIPRLRMLAARRAAVLSDAHSRGDVAELVAGQADAHHRRRLADRADAVLLIDEDLPYLLRRLEALFRLLPRRGAKELVDLEEIRVLRLDPLLAARG